MTDVLLGMRNENPYVICAPLESRSSLNSFESPLALVPVCIMDAGKWLLGMYDAQCSAISAGSG